jgi:hypothetical protein
LIVEKELSKVLTVRQFLGKAAVRYVEQSNQEGQEIFIALLVKILIILFPKASENDIIRGVSKFVAKGSKLKNSMTEEQAVYRCYWVHGGEQYDEECVDIEGEETGPISICTFPGLERMIKTENFDSVARAVKASALSESAFVIQ